MRPSYKLFVIERSQIGDAAEFPVHHIPEGSPPFEAWEGDVPDGETKASMSVFGPSRGMFTWRQVIFAVATRHGMLFRAPEWLLATKVESDLKRGEKSFLAVFTDSFEPMRDFLAREVGRFGCVVRTQTGFIVIERPGDAKEVAVVEKEITHNFAGRLVSITLTDSVGAESDALSIEVDDTEGVVALPARHTEIRVELGYEETGLRDFGKFWVDTVDVEGPPDKITIAAHSAPLSVLNGDPDAPQAVWRASGMYPMQHKFDRTLPEHGTEFTWRDLITKAAGEHGLKFKAPEALLNTKLGVTHQSKRSNMDLIQELSEKSGHTFKVLNGHMIFVPLITGESAAALPIPAMKLDKSAISKFRSYTGDRQNYKAAVAVWRDVKAGADVEETAGSGSPVFRVQDRFATQEEAAKAAASALRSLSASGATLDIDMPMDVNAVAGRLVEMTGLRKELNGEWHPNRVEHSISDSGAVTKVSCVRMPS